MDNSETKAFIFMKAGNFGEETLEEIVERKQRELNDVGWTYWGYGGKMGTGPLHPENQVQPFAGQWMKKPGSIQVLMEKIDGGSNIELPLAKKYSTVDSVDEEDWNCLPSGIHLSRTKWALVLDKIRPCHFRLDLRQFKVGIGDKKGTNAAEYLKGKGPTSRGALVKANSMNPGREVQICITYQARLKFPHAVFLK